MTRQKLKWHAQQGAVKAHQFGLCGEATTYEGFAAVGSLLMQKYMSADGLCRHLPVHPEDSQPAEPPMDERGISTPVRRGERDMPPPLHSPLTHSAPRVEPKTLTPTPPNKPVQQTLLFGKSSPTVAEQLDNLRCQGSPMYLEREGPSPLFSRSTRG